MPDEIVTPKVDETPTPDANPKTEPAPAQQPAPDFEAWLAKQPDEVKQMYEAHTVGLKSALDKERKANKKRDDEAARKEQEAKDAQLSEVERLNKKLKALEDERNEYAKRVKLQAARDALLVAAEKIKITFANRVAEQDAIRFALESAEIDDEGAVKDAENVLKTVIKDREYLVKRETAKVETDAAKRGGSNGQTLDAAREADLRKRYRIH